MIELRKIAPEVEKNLSANISRTDSRFRGSHDNLACRALAWPEFIHDLKEMVRLCEVDASVVLDKLGENPQGIARITSEKLNEVQQRRNSLWGIIKFCHGPELKKGLQDEATGLVREVNELRARIDAKSFPLYSSLLDQFNEIVAKLNSLRAAVLSQYVIEKKPYASVSLSLLREILTGGGGPAARCEGPRS